MMKVTQFRSGHRTGKCEVPCVCTVISPGVKYSRSLQLTAILL
jgi:hypothetical protein